MVWIIWLLSVALVIYNALDVYQTWLIISMGGVEINPIILMLSSKFGLLTSIISLKIFFIVMLFIFLYLKIKKER